MMENRTMKKNQTRDARGFTLFEVIMVIVIISVISVAALPLLSGSSDQAARLEAAQIETAIRRAQTLARVEQTEYQAVFSTTNDTISVSKKGSVVEVKAAEVEAKGAAAAKSGGTGGTGGSGSASATKNKLVPEGGALTILAQAVESATEVEESFTYTLDEGSLTTAEFSGTDTLYFDTNGDVVDGGKLRVDYKDLYMTITIAEKTGVITVVETWK